MWVVERGVNDDDIIDLVEFTRKNGFAIRFVEYMDVGNSNYSDERLEAINSGRGYRAKDHKKIEMITLGG